MRILNSSSHWFALLCAVLTLPEAQLTASVLPINDNTAAPYLGVTEGSYYSQYCADYYTWLNRFGPKQFVGATLPFKDGSTWDGIAGYSSFFYYPNRTWVNGDPANRIVVICTPMFPGPQDRSGPTSGTNPGPVSFAAGANGDYDWAFHSLAQQLVANNLGNSIIRLGWEFNGGWYAWHVDNATDAANFILYWKKIVDAMRSVPGTENLKFMWSGCILAGGPYSISAAYPAGNDAAGRPYVDYVGTDVYDRCWAAGTYPYPQGATEAQKLQCQMTAWGFQSGASGNGIAAWQAIANSNGKPMCFPEWGLWNDSSSGKDNPYFIQQMYNYIQDSSHNVFLASYYDTYYPTWIEAKISPVSVAGHGTPFPNASVLMRNLYGIPLISPDADTFVRAGTYSDTNYGINSVLTVKNESSAEYQREAYLRFNLTNYFTSVVSAKLRLTVTGINTAPVQNTLYFVGDDTWTESGVTWNSKPVGSTILSTWTPAANSVIEMDVTSQFNAEIAGDKKLSLKVASTVSGSLSNVDYGSKENPDPTARPVLVITGSYSPEADALVRGGTYGDTNYGTDPVLTVKNESGANYLRESYLRFDVSACPAPVSSAKLRLSVVGISTSPVLSTLYFVSSDTWTESGITWNTKPTGSTTLGSWTPSANAVIDIDVTSQVNTEIAGDNKISLKIASTVPGSTTNVDYGSRENTNPAVRAVLLITP